MNQKMDPSLEETEENKELLELLKKCAFQFLVEKDYTDLQLFIELHQSLNWSIVENKRKYEKLGVVAFAFQMLRDGKCQDLEVRMTIWDWLQGFVILVDLDDRSELDIITSFVDEYGGIELAAEELNKFGNAGYEGILLSTLSWCSMRKQYIPRVLATGIHKIAITNIFRCRWSILDHSMALIRALSGLDGTTRNLLRQDGALSAVLPFLKDLQATDNEHTRVRRGFRCASMLIRFAGAEQSGKLI
jgi:hypothetical protein